MKKQILNGNSFERIIEYLFLSLLVLVGGSIAYFNLSDIRCSLDPDFANTIYHYTEVIKHGTLNLPNWYHTTSLELDGTMLFAVPLYFVTKDLFTAVGISNILIMLIYIVVISRLLRLYHVDRMFIYMTLKQSNIPYSYGVKTKINVIQINILST